jgi:hypothetical protein
MKITITRPIQLYLDRIGKWLKTWRLLMDPHKCNYIVFSNDKSRIGDDELKIKLLDVSITKSINPTF